MRSILTLVTLASVVSGLTMSSPVLAKNAAERAAKNEAKAAAETTKETKQIEKGHPRRAGRAAKKAEEANARAAKNEAKAAEGK